MCADAALEEIRRAWAVHLCGDQHLAVVVNHGIEKFGDGPSGFTCPALVNTIYGRWWQLRVYRTGRHTVKISRHRPDAITIAGLEPQAKDAAGQRNVKL